MSHPVRSAAPSSSGSTDPHTFVNPVLRGFNPDPTICVVPASGDTPATYFLSTSTFEFFPGCAIYSSTDLLNWKLIGHALNRRSQIELRTVEPGAGSWASTLRYRADEKRWYLANCLFQRYRPATDERIFPRGFYVFTDNIWDDNAWSDPVYFDNPGFDQDLFWDDDGKVYLSTTTRLSDRAPGSKQKDFAIHISQIDLPTGQTLTAPVVIRKSPHGIAEGSHILKRNGFYYLFTAEGGTEAGHQDPEAPSMLLRKQTSYWQTFEATMEFASQQVGSEAGLVLWWSQFSYATIGIRIGGILSNSKVPHVVSRTPKGKPGKSTVRLTRQKLWKRGGQ
ncbi:hypothetical protein KVR01_006649 [Diaporthe batatas]|uniref:uncharacterized protein n=1 Tax=Diaporthe batatas TaxID=748121 RepID=UPI001D0532AD|nr:uncharacterized protein KVR01_006649 [Diaporthe batatas]KAG8163352.1 hypothetical protein KVR01_006649 [Diaporthe batatas]